MKPAAAAAVAFLVSTPALASDRYTFDIKRFTHGGNAIRVVNILSTQPDCTPNKVSHRVVAPPKNGAFKVERGDGFGHWTKAPRDKCNDKAIPGLIGSYTPNEGFIGEDYIELHGFDDAGFRQVHRITIKVE